MLPSKGRDLYFFERRAPISLICINDLSKEGTRGEGNEMEHPLPSWNEGASKGAIVAFVARVTQQGGPDFVPPAERIAVFDNDGTL